MSGRPAWLLAYLATLVTIAAVVLGLQGILEAPAVVGLIGPFVGLAAGAPIGAAAQRAADNNGG